MKKKLFWMSLEAIYHYERIAPWFHSKLKKKKKKIMLNGSVANCATCLFFVFILEGLTYVSIVLEQQLIRLTYV